MCGTESFGSAEERGLIRLIRTCWLEGELMQREVERGGLLVEQ
jgi:hypothetical protein